MDGKWEVVGDGVVESDNQGRGWERRESKKYLQHIKRN